MEKYIGFNRAPYSWDNSEDPYDQYIGENVSILLKEKKGLLEGVIEGRNGPNIFLRPPDQLTISQKCIMVSLEDIEGIIPKGMIFSHKTK